MKKLTAYILGIVTVITFIPILESSTEVICSWLEVLKTEPMKKVLHANAEIQELQSNLEPVSTSCIGFTHNDEYLEDDDEFEEDKVKFGFR